MSAHPLLDVRNLHVTVEGKNVLQGLSFTLYPGQIHVFIGENGAGKSSLAHTLAGDPNYQVTQGEIFFQGQDLLKMSIQERATAGLFMAFQQPQTISGVSNLQFLKTAVASTRKAQGLPALTPQAWLATLKKNTQAVDLDFSFLARSINEGFSGGEQKRNELLQMKLLDPKLSLLDEMDSGLDAKALAILLNHIQNEQKQQKSFIIITHYSELIAQLQPDHVYWLEKGTLKATGNKDLAFKVWQSAYQKEV